MSAESSREIDHADVPRASGAENPLLDRRGMLRVLAMGAAGVVGAMAAPGVAAATNGDVVHVGAAASASGGVSAILASTTDGNDAVQGDSATGDGVYGVAHVATKSGVYGLTIHPSGYGVFGRGGTGVAGESDTGGIGVRGITTTGVGVRAEATTGVALQVSGIASFSRSGVAVVAKNKAYILITVPGGISASAKFLATMQSSPGAGIYISYAGRYSSAKIKVRFNKNTTSQASVFWMVID